jgi:lipopolysaccharide export system protein LptA
LIRQGLLAAALGLLLVAPALAQQPAGRPAAASGQAAEPVQPGRVTITADTFTLAENKSTAQFSGNVVISSPDVQVWAPTVSVQYANGNTSDIQSLSATGGVKLKTQDQQATGDQATYDPKSRILKLSGNVVVTSASGTLTGPLLVVNLATHVSTFSGKSGGRVTGVFNSQ